MCIYRQTVRERGRKTTWIWTEHVHLWGFFFSLNSKALHDLVGWTHTYVTTDIEGQLWDPGISGFWCPWEVLESVLWSFQGTTVETLSSCIYWILTEGCNMACGFPGGSDGKESACNAGDLGLIPWRKEWLPTPVFLPGEFQGQSMGLQTFGHDWTTNTIAFYRFCSVGCGWLPAPFLDPGSLNKGSIVPITFRGTSRSSRSRWIPGRKRRFMTPGDHKSGRLTVCKSHLVTAGPGAPWAHCQRCCRTLTDTPQPWDSPGGQIPPLLLILCA